MTLRRPEGTPGDAIGVVLPARDEARWIGACLDSLSGFLEAGDRVVVVDACSTDATADIARRAGAEVLVAPGPERGLALGQGYGEVAPGVEIVLLAHADMRLPPSARASILAAAAARPEAVGGALGHRIDDPRRRFRLMERGNAFRARRWQLPYGDQAQFVRTGAVEAAGGFPRIAWMEDLELALRLRRLGPWLYLDDPVRIPSRHWEAHGVVATTLANWTRAVLYRIRRRPPGPVRATGVAADTAPPAEPVDRIRG